MAASSSESARATAAAIFKSKAARFAFAASTFAVGAIAFLSPSANSPLAAALEEHGLYCRMTPLRDMYAIQRDDRSGELLLLESRAPVALVEALLDRGWVAGPTSRAVQLDFDGRETRPVYVVRDRPGNPVTDRGVCIGRREVSQVTIIREQELYGQDMLLVGFRNRVQLDDWYAALDSDPLNARPATETLVYGEAMVAHTSNGYEVSIADYEGR